MTKSRRRSSESGRRRLAIAGLSALVVVDLVIVVLALGIGRGEGDAAGTTPGAGVATPSPSPSVEATPAPSVPPIAELAQTRLLDMVSQSEGWRATRGECGVGGALVESTSDGGATWQPVALPRASTVVQQLVGTTGASLRLSLATLDETCAQDFDRTFSAGGSWQLDPDLAATATMVVDEGQLLIGGAPAGPPCTDPRRLVTVEGTAAIQCGTSMHVAPPSSGWQTVDLVDVLSIEADGDSLLVARGAQTPECRGFTLERRDASLETVQGTQCVPVAPTGSSIALSAVDGVLFAWSGEQVVTLPLQV